MTRWGLIARSEADRGLGIQTLAMYQNLEPDATLIIDVPQSGFKSHTENYGKGAHVVTLDDGLPEALVRDWWRDLDVVISVETLYDDRLQSWAKSDGVRTVIQGNPEFVKPDGSGHPDVWWWPTQWRLDHLPAGELIPVPLPNDVCQRAGHLDDQPSFVHIAGNRAMGDRNGSLIVRNALRGLDRHAKLNSFCQAGSFEMSRAHRGAQDLASVEDRWSMYDQQHVLVLPRRFGGLCLPALEAMASGVVVMMPDCSPNIDWPIWSLPCEASKSLQMPAGAVQTYDVLSPRLRDAMNAVAGNLRLLEPYRERVATWSEQNRWNVLAPKYYEAIDRASRS